MAKGWIQLSFNSHEEAEEIAKSIWSIDLTLVSFKFWVPLFNTSCETLYVVSKWVWLPGLPSNMWNEKSFKDLENSLGVYLKANYSFKETRDISMARILVSLDLQNDLHETINIGKGYEQLQILE